MSSPQRRALPWALSLLLMGLQLLVTYAWCSEEEMRRDHKMVQDPVFLATVGFALNTFNVQSKEEHAYRLLHILSSWRENSSDRKWRGKMVFSMNLQLRRTVCRKFEDDIENCPFQESPELNNVRQGTSFSHVQSYGCCVGCGVGTGAAAKPF
ncbi:cystatin-9 isoform X1 [Callithrix jacchus]|uniref:Cystatin 9 n=1 Tax=Callithrix jacchus TaxID=9483 RepID=A0A8I3X0Z8_CALJA|nr:cystatin-9 [Callithrix jacchus]XP_054111262.1 cystatin-9 [Callithrix jacchus]XP_054111263.1 cystatin-9 [Callithrix jacchus]XP_054111264.1 cystatin-9 [Callithrix jacchus]